MNNFRLRIILLSVATILLAAFTNFSLADEIKLKLLSSGATAKIGSYIPQHVMLSSNKPDEINHLPPGLIAPLFGTLKLGPAESPTTFFLVLDEPPDKPARLFIDANANGDLTDDPPAEWKARTNKLANGKQVISYSGGAMLKVPYGSETLAFHIPMYRFDKNDTQHGNTASMLFYYGDYAWSGVVNLGGKFYQALLADRLTTGDFRPTHDTKRPNPLLFIDVNGDGKFDLITESFPAAKSFRLAGGMYQISGLSASGDSVQISKAAIPADEINAVVGLQKGNRAPAFEVATTAGQTVKFPDAYAGKIVLLDFWATWCPPCREEIPNIAAAYQQFHARGFDILGVSLDQANDGAELSSFTQGHNMPWPQIYDGKYWRAAVAQLYHIESIPHAFLIDGDTGIIIAEGDSLRGPRINTIISEALAKRGER